MPDVALFAVAKRIMWNGERGVPKAHPAPHY